MHPSVMDFGRRVLTRGRVHGRHVLEVGARNVNGSLRAHVLSLEPSSYTGVDILDGPGVDVVMAAEDLPALWAQRPEGPGRWDLVLSTEMLEHARDWRRALYGCKAVTAIGGFLLLTTRGPGFPRHEHPGDHWRFTPELLRAAMTGFRIIELSPDPQEGHPGVLMLARCRTAAVRVPVLLEAEPAP